MIDEKQIKSKAQGKVNEICAEIGDGTNSLLQILVRGFRTQAISQEKAQEVFNAIRACVGDAESNYHAAIAQPEAKVSLKPRVIL